MKKKKSEIKWIDVPIRPLPRHISFVLEDILTELRQIREDLGKTGAYPVPRPGYPVYPDDRPPWNPDIPPSPFPTPWTPVWYCSSGCSPHYSVSPGINAPGTMAAPPGDYCDSSGEGLRPKDCFTKKELEDKFGVKK
jgi:hypothetical protein